MITSVVYIHIYSYMYYKLNDRFNNTDKICDLCLETHPELSLYYDDKSKQFKLINDKCIFLRKRPKFELLFCDIHKYVDNIPPSYENLNDFVEQYVFSKIREAYNHGTYGDLYLIETDVKILRDDMKIDIEPMLNKLTKYMKRFKEDNNMESFTERECRMLAGYNKKEIMDIINIDTFVDLMERIYIYLSSRNINHEHRR